MFRAKHAIVSLIVGSSIAVLNAGCASDTNATPQVVFSGRTTNSAGKDCRDSGPLFDVGSFGNVNATPPVPSMAVPTGQGNTSVSCSVVSNGTDSFAVSATVSQTGVPGGIFTVEGTFKKTGEQTNIHVLASNRLTANTYDEKDRNCVARYTGTQAVKAGAVWATITCPNAVFTSDENRACAVEAEFRFENCAQ